MSDKQLAQWEATIWHIDLQRTREVMKTLAKKWEFQLEKCPTTGKEHYQAGFSLHKKAKLAGVLALIPEDIRAQWSLRPMSNPGAKSWTYSGKVATRVDGPWTHADAEPAYIPKHVRGMELRPWQASVKDMCAEYDDRIINLLYCPEGGIGKSMVIDYLDCHQLAEAVPPLNDAKDIMQLVCCVVENRGGSAKAPKAFLFDLPRAMKKDKLVGLYSAIEQIKDGRAYDLRYAYKKHRFDRPAVWVFTNTKPDTKMLSQDRWRFWRVEANQLAIIPSEAEFEWRAAGAL